MAIEDKLEDKLEETVTELQMRLRQIEEAHQKLDTLDIPRRVADGGPALTLYGRIERFVNSTPSYKQVGFLCRTQVLDGTLYPEPHCNPAHRGIIIDKAECPFCYPIFKLVP